MKKIMVAFMLLLFCYAPIAMGASDRKTLFVSIIPQKYFIQQISGDLFDVQVMVQPGASPATYEPKPSQMKKIAESKLYFAIGVPYEKVWLEKLQETNPQMKIIHTDHGIEKLEMAEHSHDEDEHGEEHHDDHHGEKAGHKDDHHDDHHGEEAGHEEDHHDHGGSDPHIWLSTRLVAQQAEIMRDALVSIAPEHATEINEGTTSFQQDLQGLRNKLDKLLAPYKGRKFMVFHPSWGYFANEFGLEQVAAEIEGKDPKPRQLQELIEFARHEKIHTVFAQPQFSKKSAKVIAKEIDGQVLLIDPLAPNWSENLEYAAGQISSSLMDK